MNKVLNCAAVDLGASGGKVAGRFDGAKVALQEIQTRFPTARYGWVTVFVGMCRACFKEVKSGLGMAGKAAMLDSIGLTPGATISPANRDGNLMESPLLPRPAHRRRYGQGL
jgi:hypothetical protein